MKKLFIGLFTIIALIIGGLAVFVATLDADKYRDQISTTLSQQTGRTVKLGGPLSLGLSWSGVTLRMQDASISNPSWASQPVMAGIGSFDLGVSLPPLLDHKLVITRLEIKNADIDLEAQENRNNWDIMPAGGKAPAPVATKASAAPASSGAPVSIHVDKLSIADSQVKFKDKTGKTTIFKLSKMTLGAGTNGEAILLEAEYNGTPISVNVKTGSDNLLSGSGKWPFDADLTYANYKVMAKGNADLDGKKASISSYEVNSGNSSLQGQLSASWGGAKPSVTGTLNSDKLNPADFKPAAQKGDASTKAALAPTENGHVFSDAPLRLDGLKAANASLDVGIKELVLTNGSLKNLTAKISLNNGLLTLSPFKVMLGAGTIEGQIKASGATEPAQVGVTVNASNVELEDLLHMANAPNFLSGKANVEINLAGTGNSAHAIASTAVGVMNLTAASGNVSSSAANSISSGLMQLFAPGGSTGLNCLAARFIVKGGDAKDNGILVDTGATTVAGSGDINLGQETLNMAMHAKPKLVSAASGLLPPLNVTGTFTQPHFGVDASETIQKVAGLFLNGGVATGVPDMQTASGQNACVYTLDHPKAAPTPSPLPASLTGKAADQIKNIGGALQGLGILGH